MKKILFLLTILFCQSLVTVVVAQPQRSRVQSNNNRNTTARRNGNTSKKDNANATKPVSRADLMFPTAVPMPEEVVWRRDLYRDLDLKEDANAPLSFPVRPMGKRMNLCALIYKLVGAGRLPIYKYSRADGYEDFSENNKMTYKELLEQSGVPTTYDKLPDDLIPSEDIVRYFIKESNYYDQNTATYKSKVTAICPVYWDTQSSYAGANKPLCWIKYDDIAPYLNSQIIMTSNVNNASTMSMADFFATNHYKGKIYTTSNMQGRSLAQEAKPDSTGEVTDAGLKVVQDRIEKEMKDFEKRIWTTPVDSAELARRDSIAKSQIKTKAVVASDKTRRGQTSTGNATTQKAVKKEKTAKSFSSSSPRVSARRQRH